MHSLNEGKRGEEAPRQLSGRGLAYWTDGKEERIIYVTPGYQMIALDAKTGDPHPGLRPERHRRPQAGHRSEDGLDEVAEIGLHATPVVAKDVVIIGAAHLPGGSPRGKENDEGLRPRLRRAHRQAPVDFPHDPAPGRVRQRHVAERFLVVHRQHRRLGADQRRRGARALVYLPIEIPTGDYYGGHRPGNNLFAESLVAVDLKTGKRKWHYQLVHHGLWDHDIPCAPILMDLVVDGKPIKAVGQPTKQGWIYTFDRVTGQPVWPIVERPVEKGDVPGEWYSPTQPFVTKPPPFERQGVTRRRPDRFHAGAARRSDQGRVALQDGPAVHAAGREHSGRVRSAS